jgi:predicted nucleotidyltransferase component of viral defense system
MGLARAERHAGSQVNETYLAQARILTQVAPLIFADGTFALKGGTAINLFVRDMPRLSVDLDLAFPDYTLDRDSALRKMGDALAAASQRLTKQGFDVRSGAAADETKLLVRRDDLLVKVEANHVIRGTVGPVHRASLKPRAREMLRVGLDVPVVSLEDLYGGKLVAALDRQHPRDLFDVMELFDNEGITPGIRRAFVVYLASHNKPLHDVLDPTLLDVSKEFETAFQGMTTDPIALSDLLAARDRMIAILQSSLDQSERDFLLSLVRNDPDWGVLDIPNLDKFPAIRWKLHNLDRLRQVNQQRYHEQYTQLAALLK